MLAAPVIGAMPLSVDAGGWVHIWKGALPTRMNLEKRWPGAAVGGRAGLQAPESPTAAAGAISMNREHPAYGRVLD